MKEGKLFEDEVEVEEQNLNRSFDLTITRWSSSLMIQCGNPSRAADIPMKCCTLYRVPLSIETSKCLRDRRRLQIISWQPFFHEIEFEGLIMTSFIRSSF